MKGTIVRKSLSIKSNTGADNDREAESEPDGDIDHEGDIIVLEGDGKGEDNMDIV